MVTHMRIPEDEACQAFFESLPERGKWRHLMNLQEKYDQLVIIMQNG